MSDTVDVTWYILRHIVGSVRFVYETVSFSGISNCTTFPVRGGVRRPALLTKKKLHRGDGTVYYHLLPTELPYHFSAGHFLLLSDDNPEVSAHLSSPPCVSNT